MGLEELISHCRKQDRKAQEALYRKFSGKFFSLCLKYSSSYELARDNLQEGFMKIFQNISQYRGKGSFEGWMTRIIINTALKEYQGRSVFLAINEEHLEETEVEIETGEAPSGDFLLEIIEELPERYRLVFNLYVLDGFSHREIAGMLDISEGASKSNLARARQRLKERIEIWEQSKMESGA